VHLQLASGIWHAGCRLRLWAGGGGGGAQGSEAREAAEKPRKNTGAFFFGEKDVLLRKSGVRRFAVLYCRRLSLSCGLRLRLGAATGHAAGTGTIFRHWHTGTVY
jgi:hypothetical protein